MDIVIGKFGERIKIALFIVLCLLGLWLAVKTVGSLLQLRYVGTGITATNTIVVTGHGETFQVPDIASFNFTVVSDKLTVGDAQKNAAAKINIITSYLNSAGIDKKDIQTSDYSLQPQYTYQQVCPQINGGGCPPGKQTLSGYEVRQTTTVKVRDTSKAGDLLSNVGAKGTSEVSGLTLGFDNPDTAQQKARDIAIENAKEKAQALSKSLGVSLVRIVSYSESTNGSQPPLAYNMAAGKVAVQSIQEAPTISVGQNKVVDDVQVTYEIR